MITLTDTTTETSSGNNQPDGEIYQAHRVAEVGDEKPKQVCQYESHGRPCENEAVKAGFARTDSVVNENGVHITTETRVIWLCEEHANIYPAVPDRGASVRGDNDNCGIRG